MVDLAVKLDIIQKSGSWFSMGETRIGQGKDAAKQYLMDNPDVAEQVAAQIRANADVLMGKAPKVETPDPPDAANKNFDD
jgi:recombination protein RecA